MSVIERNDKSNSARVFVGLWLHPDVTKKRFMNITPLESMIRILKLNNFLINLKKYCI